MFNSLAYNCDFQDAIGNTAPNKIIPFIIINSAKGAAHEAAYWGSSSPGKKRSIGSAAPKNFERDSAYPRHSPEGGQRFPGHHLASRDAAGYPSIA